jgi:hypothetical protein
MTIAAIAEHAMDDIARSDITAPASDRRPLR